MFGQGPFKYYAIKDKQVGGYEEMMALCLSWVQEMMTSAYKEGGWVKKGQNHDDVILEWSLTRLFT